MKDVRAALADRDTRLLLLGQATSILGDWLLLLVFGIWVKTLTGSNSLAGLVILAASLPSLLAPLAGVLVDRVRRRPLLVGNDLVAAAAVLVLLLVRDERDVWLVFAVAAAYGATQVVLGAGLPPLLQVMVPAERIGPVNGLLSTLRQSFRLVGPLAGAGLFAAFGGGVVAVLDAVTFLVSAGAFLGLRVRETPVAREPQHWREEVAAGARHLWRSLPLRALTVTMVAAMFAFGFSETVLFALVQGLGRPPEFVGVLATVQGVGSVVGGVLATMLVVRWGARRLVWLGLAVAAVGVVGVAGPGLGTVLPGAVLIGAALPASNIGIQTLLMRATPNAVMGRVSAALDALTTAPYMLSMALGASLVAVVPYRLMYLGMAVMVGVAAAYGALRLREQPTTAGEAEPGTAVPA